MIRDDPISGAGEDQAKVTLINPANKKKEQRYFALLPGLDN
jgi:hypothetical protein